MSVEKEYEQVRSSFPRLALLLDQVNNLFDDLDLADLCVIYEPGKDDEVTKRREWHLHKAIVCPQSSYMRACTKKNSDFAEAKDQAITLNEVPGGPSIVDAVLNYMYRCDYAQDQLAAEMDPMTFHVYVAALADYLGMPRAGPNGLEALADAKFTKLASKDWGTPGFADAVHLICQEFHGAAIDQLYQTVLNIASKHLKEIFSPANRARYQDLLKVMEDTPILLTDICKRATENGSL